ncbi:MAG: hypothetical protein E7391_05940 [Ruminococcaceae bacterium]|nr:hypothetical protein [Oscillospiraceae bacterium]
MDKNEEIKLKNALNDILKNNSLKKSTTEDELVNLINNTDKTEITKKLDSMGLSFVSNKLKSMSDAELLSMIKNNPNILNKLNSFLK